MSTTIRPELAKDNKYFIPRHRYYELKHFCMQYPGWKKLHNELASNAYHSTYVIKAKKTLHIPSHSEEQFVEKCAILQASLFNRINMVETAAKRADESLAPYILEGATLGISYDIIKLRMNIPCCKKVYYEVYRRFFAILDSMRD